MPTEMRLPVGDVLPELILLGGGVAVLLYALLTPRRAQVGAAPLALATLAAAAVATTRMLGRPQILTFSDTYALDGAALWSKLIILGVTAVAVPLADDWFRPDARQAEFYTLLLFSALGAVLLAGAADLMELVLGALLSSATGYVMTAYHRQSRLAGEAAVKYYLLGGFTNGALLYGTALFFGLAATTTFPGLQSALARDATWISGVAAGLVVLGLAFKMAAVPAHAWMPDVAEGAPAPVAAFLTVASKVGALVALARLAVVLPDGGVGWRPLVAVLSAATMTLGNLAALWQDDVRRLLGWSAVSQTGYGLMALVALGRSELAIPSLLYFLLAYALGNLAAFGVVVALRGLTGRLSYRGIARTRPLLTLALVVSFLSFIGIPPLAGFTAKLALFAAAIEAGFTWLAVLAVVNTVVSVAYYARVLAPAYFDPPSQAHRAPEPRAAIATGLCALGLIGVGLASDAFIAWFAQARVLP